MTPSTSRRTSRSPGTSASRSAATSASTTRSTSASSTGGEFWAVTLVGFAASVGFLVLMQGVSGRTPGKAMLGIRTVDESGQPPGFGKAIDPVAAAVRRRRVLLPARPHLVAGVEGPPAHRRHGGQDLRRRGGRGRAAGGHRRRRAAAGAYTYDRALRRRSRRPTRSGTPAATRGSAGTARRGRRYDPATGSWTPL